MTRVHQQTPTRPVVSPSGQAPKPGPRKPFVFTDWAMI